MVLLTISRMSQIFIENLGLGWDNELHAFVEKKGLEVELWCLLGCWVYFAQLLGSSKMKVVLAHVLVQTDALFVCPTIYKNTLPSKLA